MVPQVYKIDNQLRRLVAFDQVEVELIETISMSAAIEPKIVKQHLAQAWGKTLKMKPPSSNPTSGVISIPFSPNYRV